MRPGGRLRSPRARRAPAHACLPVSRSKSSGLPGSASRPASPGGCGLIELVRHSRSALRACRCNILEDCGHSLTTPDAHALKAVASTATAQLPQQSGQDPPARRSDGMAE